MIRRIKKWMVVVLLVISIGGHWAILQSAAWAGMFISYSPGATLSEALTKTFDGNNPCNLCKLVREGEKTERAQEMLKAEVKFEFSLMAATADLFPPRPCPQFINTVSSALARLEAPLTPPPRSA